MSHDIGKARFTSEPENELYDLSSVIIHHGVGLQSGHYTSYCWNHEAC